MSRAADRSSSASSGPNPLTIRFTAYAVIPDDSQRWDRVVHCDLIGANTALSEQCISEFGRSCATSFNVLEAAREARTHSEAKQEADETDQWQRDVQDCLSESRDGKPRGWVERALGTTDVRLESLSFVEWQKVHPEDSGVNTSGRFANRITVQSYYNGEAQGETNICKANEFDMSEQDLRQVAGRAQRYQRWRTTPSSRRSMEETIEFGDRSTTAELETVLDVWSPLNRLKPDAFPVSPSARPGVDNQ